MRPLFFLFAVLCSGWLDAAPYLVTFRGAIDEVEATASESFTIGERVRGAFVYDPDAPVAIKHVLQFTPVDVIGAPHGEEAGGGSGFVFDGSTLISQVFRGGAVMIETEGGLHTVDQAIDLFWLGSGGGGDVRFVSAPRIGVTLGNSGSLLNVMVGEEAVASSFEVLRGPPVVGFRLTLGHAPAEIVDDGTGLPEATLRSLADPENFPGLVGGQLLFAPIPLSFSEPHLGASFAIDEFEVIAVPEPAAAMLVVLWLLAPWRR